MTRASKNAFSKKRWPNSSGVIQPKSGYEERQRRDINSKDGFRLFDKLQGVQERAFDRSPSLIPSGTDFHDALTTYKRLVGHVEQLWTLGCTSYLQRKFPFAVLYSILAIEETGTMGRLWFDLLAWDRPSTRAVTRKHHVKHFLGLVPGAVVNARLDRVLGTKEVKVVLQDAASGRLKRLGQSCLYIDVVDGKTVLPEDIVSKSEARFMTVLAGEL